MLNLFIRCKKKLGDYCSYTIMLSKFSGHYRKMGVGWGWWSKLATIVAAVAILRELGKRYGWEIDKEAALNVFGQWSDQLGIWAMPVYVGIHTITLALCLPYAVFFEATASLLFGFFPAVICVFSAKVLGASLSFWIGRFVLTILVVEWFFFIQLWVYARHLMWNCLLLWN